MSPLDCETCQEALADCLDAEVPPTGEVALHLAGCTACAAAWADLQEAWRALRPEGLTLSAAAQDRVLAYAAAHAPSGATAVRSEVRRPIGRWFWAVFAAALALVVWKFGAAPDAPRPAAPAAVAELGNGVRSAPQVPQVGSGTSLAATAQPAAASGSGAASEVALAARPRRPVQDEVAPPPAPDTIASLTKEEAGAPKPRPVAAPIAAERPRTRAESTPAAGPALPAEEEAKAEVAEVAEAAPRLAAAPMGKAAVRESRAFAAAPSIETGAGDSVATVPSAPAGLDAATRAVLEALAAQAPTDSAGWGRLRSALAAPTQARFESVLAGCGSDALLCDGAALGAGALRAASRRSDAAALLQRAARSSSGSIASVARRLLSGP